MTQTAITEAAQGLIERVESVHRLLFRTAHLCARSQLHNLRRECERAMTDLKAVENGLSLPAVQEELARLQAQRDSIKAQPAKPETEAKGA